LGGAFAIQQRGQFHTTTAGLNEFSANDPLIFPVRTFDKNVRANLFNELQRVESIKDGEIINDFNYRQYGGSIMLIVNRSLGAFQMSDGIFAVES